MEKSRVFGEQQWQSHAFVLRQGFMLAMQQMESRHSLEKAELEQQLQAKLSELNNQHHQQVEILKQAKEVEIRILKEQSDINLQTITTTSEAQIKSLEKQLAQIRKASLNIDIFKEQALIVNEHLRKVQLKFFKQLGKIYNFFQELISFTDQIKSMAKEDQVIKDQFGKIIDWEKQFDPETIENLSKRDKKLMQASLYERDTNSKIIDEWIKEAIQWCDVVWDNGLDITKEFCMPYLQGLREALPPVICQQTIEENRSSDNEKIKGMNTWDPQSIQTFYQRPYEQIKLISKFSSKYNRKKKYIERRISQCQVSLNSFIPIHLPQLSDKFLQWTQYIKETASRSNVGGKLNILPS